MVLEDKRSSAAASFTVRSLMTDPLQSQLSPRRTQYQGVERTGPNSRETRWQQLGQGQWRESLDPQPRALVADRLSGPILLQRSRTGQRIQRRLLRGCAQGRNYL